MNISMFNHFGTMEAHACLWIFLFFLCFKGYHCIGLIDGVQRTVYVSDSGETFNSSEAWLYSDLFDGYNAKTRPVYESNDAISVELELGITQIRNLDQQQQIMETYTYVKAEWYDELLVWDANKYRQGALIVPASEVWLPDFGIGNSASEFYDESWYENFHVRLRSDGLVIWVFGSNMETVCSMDLREYPFDTQRCSIELTNWMYLETMVNLTLGKDSVGFDFYLENGEWDVESSTCSRKSKPYITSLTVPLISCELTLKRQSYYYVINLIIPTAILAILVVVVHWLPAGSGEKMGFSITVLLSFYVLQLSVSESIPKDSRSTPNMSKFLIFVMGLSCSSILIQILILYIYYGNQEEEMPRLVKKIFLEILGRALCMGQNTPKITEVRSQNQTSAWQGNNRKLSINSQSNADGKDIENSSNSNKLSEKTEEKIAEEREKRIRREWETLAAVLDRLFFYLTVIAIIIASLVYFL